MHGLRHRDGSQQLSDDEMWRYGSEREEKRLSAANESHHARSIELSLSLTGGFNTELSQQYAH